VRLAHIIDVRYLIDSAPPPTTFIIPTPSSFLLLCFLSSSFAADIFSLHIHRYYFAFLSDVFISLSFSLLLRYFHRRPFAFQLPRYSPAKVRSDALFRLIAAAAGIFSFRWRCWMPSRHISGHQGSAASPGSESSS